MSDEPLSSTHGHPIGIRRTFQVNFPRALNSLGQEPPADSPSAELYMPDPSQKGTLMYFANRSSTLRDVAHGGFAVGTTTVTIDTLPAFMPLLLQMPSAFPGTEERNRCFRWENTADRQWRLATGPQRAYLEIGPYSRYVPRGSLATSGVYQLSDFYASIPAKGAVECRP